MSGKSKNRKQFFTLIELLVVIAIIAVLAGILMPALASARARSRAVKCQSNMSQLAMVFNYYGDDSGGYLPCLDNIGGAGAINSKGETVDAKSWLNDTVKRYLGKVDASKQPVELLRCPDEESLVDITTNYGLNYLVATRGVVENSGHLCYYPGVTNPGNLHNTGSSYGKNRAAYFRHAERAVTAFIDGHVELREKMSVPCLESFPEATAQMVENTVFNKGKADGSQPGISGM